MLTSNHQRLIISVLLLLNNTVIAEQLTPFSSDGCSNFPDGTLADINLWCGCCIVHDIAYWQGGNQQQKKQADEELRACVLKTTANKLLADTMYAGVRLGGSPIFPVWYRWGYGWEYGRGFQSLNQEEKQDVATLLLKYKSTQTESSCDFDYPPVIMIKKTWNDLIEK